MLHVLYLALNMSCVLCLPSTYVMSCTTCSENANAEEDNPMSTQWSESSLQSGFSKDTGHDPVKWCQERSVFKKNDVSLVERNTYFERNTAVDRGRGSPCCSCCD